MVKRQGLVFLLVFLLISACNSKTTEVTPPLPEEASQVSELAETESVENGAVIETEDPTNLPPDPINLTIPTEDGAELKAIFYPAGIKSAPIIVLMHWYPGDQYEWTEIAYWLQNRGLQGEMNGVPWKDPSWFPKLDQNESYNVLTFSFRGCEGRCDGFQPELWLVDAKTALEFSRTLDKVDSQRVISIGASIGADGAIDGCAAVLDQDPSACLGALSLSPGNYLDLPYSEMVKALGEQDPPRPAWCLFDQNDADSGFCSEIKGSHYYMESWSDGNLHGMHLITPNLEPKPLEIVLQFIRNTLDN